MSARDSFVADRKARWVELEQLLGQLRGADADYWRRVATLYRSVCSDLSRAQSLGLDDDIVRHLDELAGRAHNRLYSSRRSSVAGFLTEVAVGFPREIAASWPFFVLANVLFYGPFVVGALGALGFDGFAASVLTEAGVQQMEAMYASDVGRTMGQDASMAGFYVWNNVGIAFRCFATGALAGLGTVFYLVYNGLMMGVVEGHLWRVGLGWNLLEFTAGHTAWELTGVVVAGAAGLKLGWSMVYTAGRTRAGSVRAAGPGIYRLILGATALLFIAAAVEGFWSAGPQPLWMKLVFGALSVVAVGVWVLSGVARRLA